MTSNSAGLPSVISCINGEIHFASDQQEIVAEIVIAVINIVTSLLGTVANSLVIMAYYRNHRLRTVQNTIFLSLAITDIGVTVFVQPTYVVAIFSGLLGKRDCLVWDITTLSSTLFLGVSLVTVAILSFQSYVTLAYPYRIQSIVTKHRLRIAVVFSWLLIMTVVLKSIIFGHAYFDTYICASIIFLTIISVICTWGWTYKLVARHRRIIQATQTPTTQNFVTRKTVLRSTVTAVFVTFSLFGCYSLGLLLSFHKLTSAWSINRNLYLILYIVSWTLMYLNSLLNPCLLFWRSSKFRETAKNILI
jgi:hypothetical protein